MAFIRKIEVVCVFADCRKKANWEVVNRYNALCGRFCKKHADIQLRYLRKLEREKA